MNENPYASPTIPDYALAAAQPRPPIPVSHGKRFVHFFVDSIIANILVQVSAFALGIIYGLVKVSAGGRISQADLDLLRIIGFFWGLGVLVAYYLVMEALFQRTVAKLLTGSVVVTYDGRRPTFGQIVGRSFARLIPFEAFSFLKSEPVGWHDSLSKTLVVSAK